MTVWIVKWYDCDESGIVSVHETEEGAEASRDEYNSRLRNQYLRGAYLSRYEVKP